MEFHPPSVFGEADGGVGCAGEVVGHDSEHVGTVRTCRDHSEAAAQTTIRWPVIERPLGPSRNPTRSAISIAQERLSPSRAALLAAYWLFPAAPVLVRLPISTIRPRSVRRLRGHRSGGSVRPHMA